MTDGFHKGRVGAPVGGEWVGAKWRGFFWAACLFNLVIGGMTMFSPEAAVDTRIIGLLVVCFGITYFLVAREPTRFAPVLWPGIIGKLGVVGLLAPDAMGTEIDWLVTGVLGLDVFFAAGFVIFLFSKGDDMMQQ